MSKDRDGIEDDDLLAPDGSGAEERAESTDPTDSGVSSAAPSAEDVLTDPETAVPDALDVEAELEEAERAAGLTPRRPPVAMMAS